MSAPDHPRLFISYARADGEQFARELRKRLEHEEPEITLWQDRTRMEGGVDWWRQITAALDVVTFMVLVMTPAAIASETVRREWRYARTRGVCVYPVMGVPPDQLEFDALPRWMRRAHFYDLANEWQTFVNYLKSPCRERRVPSMAPGLPDRYVPRRAQLDRLLELVLDPGRGNPVAGTVVLHGAGGFGKTTLAAALCHDDDVLAAFQDGVLWVTLGPQADEGDVQKELARLYAALTGERPAFVDAEDASLNLAEALGDRACLMVVDDVWNAAHLRPFLRGGNACARLITSRNFEIAEQAAGPRRVPVEEMVPEEAVRVLAAGVRAAPHETAAIHALAERLGEWPLMLGLAGAQLDVRLERGDTPAGAVAYLLQALHELGPVAFDPRSPVERNQALATTMEASLDLLEPAEREGYVELAIFPPEVDVPLDTVGALWGLRRFATERRCETLANLSLLTLDLHARTVRLHEVICAYLTRQAKDLSAVHARLLDAWGDPHRLPDDYAWHWIGHHLVEAGRAETLVTLLGDFAFLEAKTAAVGIDAVLADLRAGLQVAPGNRTLLQELRILDREAHNLREWSAAERPPFFAQQVLSRTAAFQAREPAVVAQARLADLGRPYLVALWRTGQESAALLRTLSRESRSVHGVAVAGQPPMVFSESRGQLETWDLESGQHLRTSVSPKGPITVFAVSSDARTVVSASTGHVLTSWDVQTGVETATLAGHTGSVNYVKLLARSNRALSASDDRTLRLWDLQTGTAVRTLTGRSGMRGVAAFSDERRAVTTAFGYYWLWVWDLEEERELAVLKGFEAPVQSVCVTKEDRHIVAGASGGTVMVWDLDTKLAWSAIAAAPRTFHVRREDIWAIASIGEHDVILALDDGTLELWDVERATRTGVLGGHGYAVLDVTVTGDGRHAVSASGDDTLKVWDLSVGGDPELLRGHNGYGVEHVAVSSDGQMGASSSTSNALIKVWDIAAGQEVWQQQQEKAATAVALAPGRSQLVVSRPGQFRGQFLVETWSLDSWDLLSSTEHSLGSVLAIEGRWVVAFRKDYDHEPPRESYRLSILDGQTGTTVRAWSVDTSVGWPREAVITSNGRRVVVAFEGGLLRWWDIDTGESHEATGAPEGPWSIAVTNDGRHAVRALNDGNLEVWDLEELTLRTVKAHSEQVTDVAIFEPRGLVMVASDGMLKVWDLETCEELAAAPVASSLTTVDADASGSTILTGDYWGNVHILRFIAGSVPSASST